MAVKNATYLKPGGDTSELISLVESMSPGLYNSSMLIRNKVLSKNVGKYKMFKESVSVNGGEFIGEAYRNITELKPTEIGEGGLMGYTHENNHSEIDFISRNANLKTANYDFDESLDIKKSLEEPANTLPWGGTLYGYSDLSTQKDSVKFSDYTDYVKSMFRYGLSFEKTVDNTVNNLMFNGYTRDKSLINDVTMFIDSHQGTILDPVPTDWALGDTKLGYIGKKMVQGQRYYQSHALTDPITPGIRYDTYKSARPKGNIDSSWVDNLVTTDSERYIDIWDKKNAKDDINSKVRNKLLLDRRNKYNPDNPYVKIRNYNNQDYENGPLVESIGPSIDSSNSEYRKLDIGYSPIDKVSKNEHGYRFFNEGDTVRTATSNISISSEDSQIYGNNTRSAIFDVNNTESSLLQKTRKLFEQHKINTLISRFHTSVDNVDSRDIQETQTATDSEFGLSHGRNLLKKDRSGTTNGYSNPYCRVWTYHHQYSKVNNLIRPFGDMKVEELQANYDGRPILASGRGNWSDKTVLNKNGFVNIAPMRNASGEKSVDIKRCMFSLENLAWKDIPNKKDVLKDEEGPLGGRIMWFPPYDLNITENSNPNWNSTEFIGRGEKLYTYTNTERTGTIQFTIVADHPSVIDYWMKNHSNGEGFIDKKEAEEDLLRFFAGCSNLDMTEKINILNSNSLTNKEKQNEINDSVDGQVKAIPTPGKDNSFSFALYFPNNLSGKNWFDDPEQMISYLMYGEHTIDNIEVGEKTVVDNNISAVKREDTDVTVKRGYEIEVSGGGITNADLYTPITNSVNQYWGKANKSEPNSMLIWGYGRDKDTAGQSLTTKKGGDKPSVNAYIDRTSYGLNSTPTSGLNTSFVDVYAALQLKDKNPALENYFSSYTTRVNEIKNMLLNPQKIGSDDNSNNNDVKRKIYYSVKGGASSHGYDEKNTTLAKNRATFLRKWIQEVGGNSWQYVDWEAANLGDSGAEIPNTDKVYDPSDRDAKLARRAIAYIWWADESVSPVVEKTSSERDNTSTQNTIESEVQVSTVSAAELRYRDEYTFFKELENDEPFLYKSIVDKVKYFDPAFHAITPEGFNGRLAFLHQCTRQGPTLENGNNSIQGYAGNLAFGRPPVCVLRLGDFYNTRIIITSMSISFEGGQWDLNPEGVGVQPVFAKINLNFTFQGGSSLGGPVTRLQNAISFNYYANQEVYDDRADIAVYNDTGEMGASSFIWVPGGDDDRQGIVREYDVLKIGQNIPDSGVDSSSEAEKQKKIRRAAVENIISSELEKQLIAETDAELVHNAMPCADLSGYITEEYTFANLFNAYKEKYGKNLLLEYTNCDNLINILLIANDELIGQTMNNDVEFKKKTANILCTNSAFDVARINNILSYYKPNGYTLFDTGSQYIDNVLTGAILDIDKPCPKVVAQIMRAVLDNTYGVETGTTKTVIERIGYFVNCTTLEVTVAEGSLAKKYGSAIENDFALQFSGGWLKKYANKMGWPKERC